MEFPLAVNERSCRLPTPPLFFSFLSYPFLFSTWQLHKWRWTAMCATRSFSGPFVGDERELLCVCRGERETKRGVSGDEMENRMYSRKTPNQLVPFSGPPLFLFFNLVIVYFVSLKIFDCKKRYRYLGDWDCSLWPKNRARRDLRGK